MKIEDEFRVDGAGRRGVEGAARRRAHRAVHARRAAPRGRGRRVPRHREGQGRPDHRAVQGRRPRSPRPTRPHRTVVLAGRGPRHAWPGQRVGDGRRPRSRPTATAPSSHRHRPQRHRQGRAVRPRRAWPTCRASCSVSSPRTSSATSSAAGDAAAADRRRGVRSRDRRQREPGRRRLGRREHAGPRKIDSPEAEPIDLIDDGRRARWRSASCRSSSDSSWSLLVAPALTPPPEAPQRPPTPDPYLGVLLVGSNPCSIRPAGLPLVLGIDPGVSRCGYGVVRARRRHRVRAVACGVIRTAAGRPAPGAARRAADELDGAGRRAPPGGDGGRAGAVPGEHPHRDVGGAGERARARRRGACRCPGRALQPERGEAGGHRRRRRRQGRGAADGDAAARAARDPAPARRRRRARARAVPLWRAPLRAAGAASPAAPDRSTRDRRGVAKEKATR